MDAGWVALGVGAVGVVSSLVAQALFWGTFKGSVDARLEEGAKRFAALDAEQGTMKVTLNAHGERISSLETACKIHHPNYYGE